MVESDVAGHPSRQGAELLVVEDDQRMVDFLRRALEGRGYSVQTATDGPQALHMGLDQDYAAVILDVMIPEPDGMEVLRSWRAAGRTMPVLLLTARDAVANRVEGLDTGADDYLTKPFAVVELFARVQRLLERPPLLRATVLECGDLRLDPARHTVTRGDTVVQLSTKEFTLLQELMRHPGQVLTRTHLLEHVWDFSYDGDSNVIDVYIGYLRGKVDRPFGVCSIETVHGVGYRLRPASANAEPTVGTDR
jgi:two-component system OmpR family response regulator